MDNIFRKEICLLKAKIKNFLGWLPRKERRNKRAVLMCSV
jgi:hypothetical protein